MMAMSQSGAAFAWAAGLIVAALMLATLSAWFYFGTEIFLVYLEQGLSYCF